MRRGFVCCRLRGIGGVGGAATAVVAVWALEEDDEIRRGLAPMRRRGVGGAGGAMTAAATVALALSSMFVVVSGTSRGGAFFGRPRPRRLRSDDRGGGGIVHVRRRRRGVGFAVCSVR